MMLFYSAGFYNKEELKSVLLPAWRYASTSISCHRVSVTQWYCIKMAPQSRPDFCIQVSLWCVLGKLGYLQNKGTSQTLDLENIATAHRPSASAIHCKQRQQAVWCWKHLVAMGRRQTRMASAAYSQRRWAWSSVYSAMVDWAWGASSRESNRRELTCLNSNRNIKKCVKCVLVIFE